MAAHVRYVRTRDGVFQYERRVPVRIQRDLRRFAELFNPRPLFRRTLGTKDVGAMHSAARAIHDHFEQLIDNRPVNVAAPTNSSSMRIVTAGDLHAIVERYRGLIAEPFERLHRRANIDPAAAEELARVEYELEQDAETIRATVRNRHDPIEGMGLKPADEARHIVVEHGFAAPEGSEQLGTIISAVRAGLEQGYAHVTALGDGTAVPALPSVAEPRTKGLKLTLGEAVYRYLETRNLPPKAISETRLALRQFEHVVGRKLLSAITREDVHHFVAHLAEQKVGGKTKGSIVRHLSIHSIGKRLRMLGAAINHAIQRGWLTTENPMHGIKVANYAKLADKAVMPAKRRLQVSELNLIFQHPWFTGCLSPTQKHLPGSYRLQGSEYWVPIVAVLTGCRAAELGGMRLSDVRLDSPQPHFIVRNNEYRPTKNTRSRCVPILDVLLGLGFANYVEGVASTGADRLFPDWTAAIAKTGPEAGHPAWSNAAIIRAFNRTVIGKALAGTLLPGVRQDVTFHSMRGAFKAMLGTTNNLPINVVHEVVGHAKSELDTRYIGEITIEETYPFVRACNYSGLILPPPPPTASKIPQRRAGR